MQISKRELAEARAIASKMSALRHQTRMLALLLASLAALSTVVGAFGLVRSNRRLSRAVAERTAQIAAVDASRRLFFAKVSHELRTPVTVMRGEAEVALATRASNPDAPVAALREVIANSEFFGRRIEELLALSQAEDGRLAIVKTPVDMAEIIRGAIDGASRFAISNRVSIKMTSNSSTMIDGDARWLQQALLAVLDNAVKFSHDGADVEVASATTDGNELLITIADHGRGVAPEELPRLFDAYYQTEAGRTRGGNGLGLALSRWIVEQHGGKVSASQRSGGGCQVELRLPLAA